MLNRISTLFRPAVLLAGLLAVGGCDSATTVADYEAEEARKEALAFLAAAGAGSAARILADFGLPADWRVRASIPALDGIVIQGDIPDPECEWKKGDSLEKVIEFVRCGREHSDPGCRTEIEFRNDGAGGSEVVGIPIHCDDEDDIS